MTIYDGAELINSAHAFAEKVFWGRTRDNRAKRPVIDHMQEVATLVHLVGGSPEEVAAGWLHDTVEDTETTLEQIKELFGLGVAKLVAGVTDLPEWKGLPVLERKRLQAERVRLEGLGVRIIKISDQISNIRTVRIDPPISWKLERRRNYVLGARTVVDACKGTNVSLERWFSEEFQKVAGLYGIET